MMSTDPNASLHNCLSSNAVIPWFEGETRIYDVRSEKPFPVRAMVNEIRDEDHMFSEIVIVC